MKILDLVLGIVTSIGGFVEAGSISTAAQAGAEFGFALLWAIAVATLILAMLSEMAGRVAIVGRRSIAAAIRERFGIHYQLALLGAELGIDLLLLTAELGGAATAVKMLTGVGFQWWVLPIAAALWLLLWVGSFAVVEDGVGLFGLATLAFVVSAWLLHPGAASVARGFVPSLPGHDLTRYGFLSVSIVGATVSPYLLNFYGSGTIEEKLKPGDLWINRTTSYAGMSFGSVVAMGVLITSAVVLEPKHVMVDSYELAATMFVPVFGAWSTTIFAVALGIGCFGAALELTVNAGYLLAQSFGWSWGIDKQRRNAARFVLAFSVVLSLAALIAVTGIDPLQLTLMSVALTVVVLPFIVLPFLVLMNDQRYVGAHRSGAIGNVMLAALTVLYAILAVVVIPLQIAGGG